MKDYSDKLRIQKGIKKLFDGSSSMREISEKVAKKIEKNMCALCKNNANEFEDALSKKEYLISGMCQTCQNIIFAGGFYNELD